MTEDQLLAAAVNNADQIYATLGADRDALSGAIVYIIAHLADKIRNDTNLVEAVDFLFALDEQVSALADDGEEKIRTEFQGRGNELLSEILKL